MHSFVLSSTSGTHPKLPDETLVTGNCLNKWADQQEMEHRCTDVGAMILAR